MKKTVYTLFLFLLCLCYVVCMVSETCEVFAEESSENSGNFSVSQVQTEENAFRVIRQTGEKISLTYIFPVNSSIMQDLGFSAEETRSYRFYLTVYVAALASQNRDKATSGVEVGYPVYFSDVDGIGFSILFDDIAAQKNFFGVSDDENASANISTSGLFIQRTTMTTSFPISASSADNLKTLCTYAITAFCSDKQVDQNVENQILATLDESVFIYDFASSQTALKSELMADDENFHHNLFVRTYSTLSEDICFFYTTPNVPIFYILAVIFTIVAMIFVYFFSKRKRLAKT